MRSSLSFTVILRIVANLFGVCAAFVSLHLYNLYLTKEAYGAVLVASQFLVYLPLIGGGFEMVLGQQMLSAGDPKASERIARYNQVLQSHILVVAFAAALAVMAIYSQTFTAISSRLSPGVFLCVGLAGVVSFYGGSQFGLLTGLGRQADTVILTGICSLTTLLILWLGFLAGLSVWALPVATAAGVGLLIPVAWLLQRQVVPDLCLLSWRRDEDFGAKLTSLWKPSVNWLQSQLAIMMLFTVDLLLIGCLFGPAAATVYGVITRVTTMARQVIYTLCESAWPRLAQEPSAELKADLMRKVDRLNAWLAGAWFGAMGATLQPFLGWFVRLDWIAGGTIIALIILRNTIVSLSAPHGYGLISAGRFRELARSARSELITMVTLILIFTHFIGSAGVAWGALVGTVGGSLWYTTYLYFAPLGQARWLEELAAIYARALISAVVAFSVASLGWYVAGSVLHLAGWAAVPCGGCGLLAGLSVGTLFGRRQGGASFKPFGPWLKLPAHW